MKGDGFFVPLWFSQAFENDADLPGRIIAAFSFSHCIQMWHQPGAEGFGAYSIHGRQFFVGGCLYGCFIRSAHNLLSYITVINIYMCPVDGNGKTN